MYSCAYLFIHLFIYLSVYLSIYSFIHLCIDIEVQDSMDTQDRTIPGLTIAIGHF